MTKGRRGIGKRKGATVWSVHLRKGDSRRERKTGEKSKGKRKARTCYGWVVKRRPARQLLVVDRVTRIAH